MNDAKDAALHWALERDNPIVVGGKGRQKTARAGFSPPERWMKQRKQPRETLVRGHAYGVGKTNRPSTAGEIVPVSVI